METDRPRGILSKSDREFLMTLGDDLKEQSVRNARQRIRDRIRNGLEDFDFLLSRPQRRDFQTISDDVSRDSSLYNSIVSTVAFCFRLVEYANIDPSEIVTLAVRKNQPFAENVNVEIDYDVNPPIDVDSVRDRINRGELPNPVEVGVALGHGKLTTDDIEKLKERVEQSESWGPEAMELALSHSDPEEDE